MVKVSLDFKARSFLISIYLKTYYFFKKKSALKIRQTTDSSSLLPWSLKKRQCKGTRMKTEL